MSQRLLRSLADDQQDRSVGVILSGMGSDGTQGLRAIKEKGGATFVQSDEEGRGEHVASAEVVKGVADRWGVHQSHVWFELERARATTGNQ